MTEDADVPGLTPSQTVGPFLGIALPWPDGPDAVPEDSDGLLRIVGRVLDGEGAPVTDALVETWQAAPAGAPPAGRQGFARCPTDRDGRFEVRTVKPGAVAAPGGGTAAPHLDVSVFARGLLDRVVTRVYFPDEPAANEADPLLLSVPADRRATLVARADGTGVLRFDVVLQGPGETVFFDL